MPRKKAVSGKAKSKAAPVEETEISEDMSSEPSEEETEEEIN